MMGVMGVLCKTTKYITPNQMISRTCCRCLTDTVWFVVKAVCSVTVGRLVSGYKNNAKPLRPFAAWARIMKTR